MTERRPAVRRSSKSSGSGDAPPALHWSTLGITNIGKLVGIWIVIHDIATFGVINPKNGAVAVLLIAGFQALEDAALAVLRELFKK